MEEEIAEANKAADLLARSSHSTVFNLQKIVSGETAVESLQESLLKTAGIDQKAGAAPATASTQPTSPASVLADVHLNDLPTNKALARALGRYVQQDGSTTRYVLPKYIIESGDLPAQTYLYLTRKENAANDEHDGNVQLGAGRNIKNAASTSGGDGSGNSLLAGYDWYNTDVGYGEPPILVESSEGEIKPTPKPKSSLDNPLTDTVLKNLLRLTISRSKNLLNSKHLRDRLLLIRAVLMYTAEQELSGRELEVKVCAFPFELSVFEDIHAFNSYIGFSKAIEVADTGMKVGGLSEKFIMPGGMFNKGKDEDEHYSFVVGTVRSFFNVSWKLGESIMDFIIANVDTALGEIPVAMSPDVFDLSKLAVGAVIGMNADIKVDLSKPELFTYTP